MGSKCYDLKISESVEEVRLSGIYVDADLDTSIWGTDTYQQIITVGNAMRCASCISFLNSKNYHY